MFFSLRKKGNKLLPMLLQVFAMGCLFVAIFDKEAVFLFKDFVDKLQLDADMQMTLIRLLLPFKMIIQCPSFCALVLILTPLVYLASNKQIFDFFEVCDICDFMLALYVFKVHFVQKIRYEYPACAHRYRGTAGRCRYPVPRGCTPSGGCRNTGCA